MLEELLVENLLLMERAQLRLGPGLNVLTGETGAGKTLLAGALDLLLGGRARAGLVRDGAGEAYVEGTFTIPESLATDERIPADARELVLARRVWPDGRTRAYLCGRSATVADLRELGGQLLAFYGQHEHRKLMLAAAQLDALDRFCGTEHWQRRRAIESSHERVRALRERLAGLEAAVGSRERELDLLRFELDEIERVAPDPTEAETLTAELARLRGAEAIRAACATATDSLLSDGVGTDEGVAGRLAAAGSALAQAAALDPALGALAERATGLGLEAEELARELRAHGESAEASPGRLEELEERLNAVMRLARKHGGGVAETLAHAERCRERIAQLDRAESSLGELQAELAEAEGERLELARELHATRAEAAPRLAEAVLARLRELSMADARFEIEVSPRADGVGMRGADAVEFRIAPNPGLPAGPLREIASGGELSRVMLALLGVAHGPAARSPRSGQTDPLLVFDEIDAGIGGRTARVVGAQLRDLAAGRQVLCITHLPQVAALAERHFTICKRSGPGPAATTVHAVSGEALLAELVRMLGADESDRAARGHARQLLRAA
jgi:DNA repair protein RecN (Recombination protein N)